MTHKKNIKRRNQQRSNKSVKRLSVGAALRQVINAIVNLPDGDESSVNSIKCGVTIKNDGTPSEIPIPEGFLVFINNEGKLMIQKKVESEAKEKPSNEEKKEEEKPITYEDIAKEFFYNKRSYFPVSGNIENYICKTIFHSNELDNSTTEAQAKRLLAFNKLQNIAKYLNKGWKPNYDDDSEKYVIARINEGRYYPMFQIGIHSTDVPFKSEDLVKEAIRIMGVESLNDLFSTDW